MAGTDQADGTVVTTAEASETARSVVPGNGGPRSAGTRQAIIDAARSAFAVHGYDRTTIRSVARAAGVDASMVMRYFGSKAGLFTAAATADLQIPDLAAVPSAERGEALVRHLIGRWEDPSSSEGLMSLLRTAATSDEVASQLQAVLGQLITGPIAATGAADADERGAFIQTQMLGVALCRYVLHQEPLASLPVAQVIATVAPSVQRYLDAPDPAISQP
jgi:AcrR family transcriptional regulator